MQYGNSTTKWPFYTFLSKFHSMYNLFSLVKYQRYPRHCQDLGIRKLSLWQKLSFFIPLQITISKHFFSSQTSSIRGLIRLKSFMISVIRVIYFSWTCLSSLLNIRDKEIEYLPQTD